MAESIPPPLFKNPRSTTERIEKFISKHHFTDCNLFGQLYSASLPFDTLTHIDYGLQRAPYTSAIKGFETSGNAVRKGFSFGPTWSTHWFKVQGELPQEWLGKQVHLRWDAGCEAMIFDKNGKPLQGLSGDYDRTDYVISEDLKLSDLSQTFFLECAANEICGAGDNGLIQPPKLDCSFAIKTAEFAVFEPSIHQVFLDLETLLGISQKLPENSHRRVQGLHAGNHIVNLLSHDRSPAQLQRAHRVASDFFRQKNGESQFQLYATANCHIDTAWLWPYAETRRKVARSWSSALRLQEKYPELVFAVSQAVQVAWLRQDYPSLYDEMCERGRGGGFVGVGGAWVEMDGLVPGGEAFVRQMLYGQMEFFRTFGKYCDIFWLPDTFGYSGQLPQIVWKAGMKRFLTQKICWNLVNKFPHHTFHWAGIDGTSVLTHFPPTDTYCARMTVEDVMKTSENFADKGRSSAALMLYGYGDGGGGPDTHMMERMRRLTDLDALPKVKSASPAQFFDHIEKEQEGLCKWKGELYLELHNGTYTSQAETKRNNRLCEFLLRDCEFLSVLTGLAKKDKIKSWEDEWKKVLLNQFHDVLPGSSIEEVYRDALALYTQVKDSCNTFLRGKWSSENNVEYLVNSLSWPRILHSDGKVYRLPPMSVSPREKVEIKSKDRVTIGITHKLDEQFVKHQESEFSMEWNPNVELSSACVSLYDGVAPEEVCNELVLYDDVPLYWDAWDVMDYHLETGRVQSHVTQPLEILKNLELEGSLEFGMKIGKESYLKQEIVVRAEQPFVEFRTSVEWRESHKILKAEFPLNVHAQTATYEIQFGHLSRPTHRNTSWDAAKFEVCGHKWADVSENGFGVALLNDSKYGYSCFEKRLVLSLLRSPKAPDANADMGHHEFTYALMPHLGSLQMPMNCDKSVIQAAYELNIPARVYSCDSGVSGESLFTVSNPGVIIESVKGAENGVGIVLRLYEAHGGKAVVDVTVAEWISIQDVKLVDLLEREDGQSPKSVRLQQPNVLELTLKPFEIISVLIVTK